MCYYNFYTSFSFHFFPLHLASSWLLLPMLLWWCGKIIERAKRKKKEKRARDVNFLPLYRFFIRLLKISLWSHFLCVHGECARAREGAWDWTIIEIKCGKFSFCALRAVQIEKEIYYPICAYMKGREKRERERKSCKGGWKECFSLTRDLGRDEKANGEG